VPCRLPLALLRDGIDYEINRNGVDIDSALGHFRYADPIGSAVDVTLKQDKSSVVACVEPGPTSVEAWWVRHTETKSERRVVLPGAISVPVKAKAFLMRSPPEFASDRVCLGAGAKVGDEAIAQANIARGQIGQGVWKGVAVAIYATRTNISSGDHLPIRPIHGASLPPGLRELRLLPLVVPL
jgi:hypothetical protein